MEHSTYRIPSIVLTVIFLLLIFVTVAATYYRYVVIRDYEVFIEVAEDGTLINLDP
jgi:hypothetical protein